VLKNFSTSRNFQLLFCSWFWFSRANWQIYTATMDHFSTCACAQNEPSGNILFRSTTKNLSSFIQTQNSCIQE